MNLDDRDQLLVRYLDGDLTPAEMDALNALSRKMDAAARASLAEMAMQAVSMVDLARMRELACAEKDQRTPKFPHTGGRSGFWPSPRRLPCSRARNGLAMAKGRPSGSPWDRRSGAVSWTTEGGQPQRGLQAGATLRRGTVSLEGAASSARLVFLDGSASLN